MSDVQNEVKKLLEETLQIQRKAEQIIEMLIKEFHKDLTDERERAKRRVEIRRKRLHVEKLQEMCWTNISQCYRILQKGMIPQDNLLCNEIVELSRDSQILQ